MSEANLSLFRATEGQRSAIADAYRQAFGFSRERSNIYVDQVGIDNFRVLDIDGSFGAVMAVIDTGHWLGGRAVRAINIAHIAINPAWRGGGLAGRFLEAVMAEARHAGIGMATLFASTRPVYRRAGFALAGLEMVYEAETTALPRIRQTSFAHVAGDNILPVLAPLYELHCRNHAGLLQRNHAHWANLLVGEPDVYVSQSPTAPGYVIVDTTNPSCLVVRDWVALNGLAASHLLTLLGTFASVYPRLRWHGAPHDPLVYALPDKGWRLVHQEEWLARILDPVVVLEQRGYDGADADIGIDLVDGVSTRELALAVRGGRGQCVARTASLPTIRIPLADFGTLLTGHRTARFLSDAGVLSGDSQSIALCDAIFAGPSPWVGEHF